ncbi:hypothetical protein [Pseudomonas aeruginosa]|uniref:hypothetical protein n=1 Tax=Pseudomonas aeruginosa TaxID=287 RepID=UPI003BF4C6C7
MNIRCPLFLEKPARLASLFAVLDPKCVIARMLRQKNCANCCAHRRKTAARLTKKLCKLLRTSPENRGAPESQYYETKYVRENPMGAD